MPSSEARSHRQGTPPKHDPSPALVPLIGPSVATATRRWAYSYIPSGGVGDRRWHLLSTVTTESKRRESQQIGAPLFPPSQPRRAHVPRRQHCASRRLFLPSPTPREDRVRAGFMLPPPQPRAEFAEGELRFFAAPAPHPNARTPETAELLAVLS